MILNKWKGQSKRKSFLWRHRRGPGTSLGREGPWSEGGGSVGKKMMLEPWPFP